MLIKVEGNVFKMAHTRYNGANIVCSVMCVMILSFLLTTVPTSNYSSGMTKASMSLLYFNKLESTKTELNGPYTIHKAIYLPIVSNDNDDITCSFTYSHSGGQLPTYNYKEISYNSIVSPALLKVQNSTSNKDVPIVDIFGFNRNVSAICNNSLFRADHNFENTLSCADCFENKLTVTTTHSGTHSILWTSTNGIDDETLDTKLPLVVKNFVRVIMKLCGC